MYSYKDILLVKHIDCADCCKLDEQINATDTPISVPSITLGDADADRNEMSRMAKKMNGEWLRLGGMTPGYPFFIIAEQYVIARPMAMHVCHGNIDDLIIIAKEDWRAFPHYRKYIAIWYNLMANNKGDYYKIRDAIMKHVGPEAFYEITSTARLCQEHKVKGDEPFIQVKAIELMLSGELRKSHRIGELYQ